MARTEEYYLSKGFDLPTAKYYANGRRKIVSVTPNDDFTLILSFDNGERRLLDVKPMLMKGTVFEPFCDIANFKEYIWMHSIVYRGILTLPWIVRRFGTTR